MTFENLDSNFEKRVQEANDKNASCFALVIPT